MVYENLNERVRRPEDVVRDTGLPVLASMPPRRHGSDVIEALGYPRSAYSEGIRALRTRIQFANGGSGSRVILVTSAEPEQGVSAVAANLAVAYAQVGARVVLIDGNLRNPKQNRFFGLPYLAGFSNFLAEPHLDVKPLLTPTVLPGLQLLLAGHQVTSSVEHVAALKVESASNGREDVILDTAGVASDLLSIGKLRDLIDMLKYEYDVILIDSPFLLGGADSLLLASIAESAILVAVSGKARIDRIHRVSQYLLETEVATLESSERCAWGWLRPVRSASSWDAEASSPDVALADAGPMRANHTMTLTTGYEAAPCWPGGKAWARNKF
ncbi:MAG: CpsD/CapB family tyrosine-protein kinase [Chloroflexia bacterium]